MNKGIFAKRLVLPVLATMVMFSAGCAHNQGNVPVRDSRPTSSARTVLKPLPVVSSAPQSAEHVVRQKETVYSIGRLYGIHPNDLIAWNGLSRPDQLDIGQTLRLTPPEAVAEPLASPGAPLETASLPEVKREPRGGKEAWSEEAWMRLQPQTADGTPPAAAPPAATMSRPEFSPSEPDAPKPAAALPGWLWPVKGAILSQFDGKGIDIAGTPGTPILAAADGKVAYVGNSIRGLGNLLIIRHNDEYLTAYAHNRVILVKQDDTVARGQKVAELGSSDSDRPKLHFELRKQGQPVDPLKYLPPDL